MGDNPGLEGVAVAVAELNGTSVAVVVGGERVRMWNLDTGRTVGPPLSGTGKVFTLAVGELDDTPIAVTGSGDGMVRIWSIAPDAGG